MLEIVILLVLVVLIAVFGPEKDRGQNGFHGYSPDNAPGQLYVPGALSGEPYELMSVPRGSVSNYTIPRKQKKKVHFAETRSERIFDVKSRKILRDRLGKT